MSDDGTKSDAQVGEPELLEQAQAFAKQANSAINGLADAVGVTAQVQKSPYATVAAALGIGYVVGGGLFTPTTARLIRMGMKLAAVPAVQDKMLDIAEAALDQVLAQARAKKPE